MAGLSRPAGAERLEDDVAGAHEARAVGQDAVGSLVQRTAVRLLASLLIDRDVRAGLAARGIMIPDDTLFLGALHDTTTDDVTVYAADHPAAPHHADPDRATRWLASAGALTRAERALRLPRAARRRLVRELRPEWALAGCEVFVAAARSRTAGRNLAGRAFLHDYDRRQDEGFGVLELILTAPVVVEGNGGALPAGPPWQSVHDGERLAHELIRVTVAIEAPHEAIGEILERHPQVRALFDHCWLHLFALDDQGRMARRYTRELHWRQSLRTRRPSARLFLCSLERTAA